jgi:hypothetical protein
MTRADRIRQFVVDNYIEPARAASRSEITIRAGDVHHAMGLANALPAVCSAIGSSKFEEVARVTPTNRTDPTNGSNVYFQFSLTTAHFPKPPVIHQRQPALRLVRTEDELDLANSIVLVSCVKSKLHHPAPARSLYTSAWFRKARDLVEGTGARWFVLSSLYGLVAPDVEIAPYDHTLNSLGVTERREWATKVLSQLLPKIVDTRRIVMFAGQRYREFLVEPLLRHGLKVDVPMAHLARGQQLAWLSEIE